MEFKKATQGPGSGTGAETVEIEEVIKITVTKEAGDILTEVLAKVNEDFEAGKVNRQDIASWIIEQFKKSFSDSEVQLIRKEFFSERHLLESILKQAKASGDVPEFLREALRKNWASGMAAQSANFPVARRPAKGHQAKKQAVGTNQPNLEAGA